MNLTLADMLRVVNGLPKVKKDVGLTVYGKKSLPWSSRKMTMTAGMSI